MRLIRPISINLIRFFLSFVFSCSLPVMAQRINQGPESTQPINWVPAILRYTDTVNNANRVNSNTCNTSTFRIRLTALPGQKIDIKDIQTLPDGNFLLAGNSFSSPANSRALICLLNNGGTIQTQKEIQVNNNPTSLFAAKATYAEDILISGTVQEAAGKLFVASLNTALISNWVTVLDMGELPVKTVMSVFNDGQIIVAAQLSAGIKYALINAAGSVQWIRQCNPAGMTVLAGVGIVDYGELNLVVNCTRTGKQVTEVITVAQTTGAIIAAYTAGNSNDEYQFGKLTSYSNRFIMTGVVKYNPGQFRLIRQIQYNGTSTEVTHTYDVSLPADFAVSSALDAAGDAPAFCLPQLGKLLFIRHFASYQSPLEYTRSYDVGTGSSIAGVSRSLTDGGYLFGLNTLSQDSILLIKTDSIGILAGCGYSSITTNAVEILNINNTLSGISSTVPSAPATPAVLQQTNATVIKLTDCNQYYCPPDPTDDPCLSTYFKTFRSNSYMDYMSEYGLMRNNTHLVLSQRNDRILSNNSLVSYSLKLLNERGDFIKGKTIFTNGISSSVVMRKMDDQHAMVIHYSTNNVNATYTFTLVNDSLNIIWSKSYQLFAGYTFFAGGTFGNITKDAEGNYYYVANTVGINQDVKLLVFKMDANGNPLWTKVCQLPVTLFVSSAVTTTPTGVIVVLEGHAPGSVSVRLDKTTGQLLNAWKYQNSAGGSVYNRLLQYDNGYVWYTGNRTENFNSYPIMMLFDTTGLPLKMNKLTSIPAVPRFAEVRNGKLNAWVAYYDGTSFKEGLLRSDTSLVPETSNMYDMIRQGNPAGFGIGDNGAVYMGGTYIYGGVNAFYADPYIRKTDSAGITGTCTFQTVTLPVSAIPLAPVAINGTVVNESFIPANIPVVFVPDTAGFRVAEVLCSSTPLCTNVQVSGPQVVCQLNQPFTYSTVLNPGCNLSPIWVYDTAYTTLQSHSGNSANFIFRRTGITKLYAKINTGCNLYTDSIEVNIQYSPAAFSLGIDTVLCPGDSVILNAGAGFNSYLWQDGSTDSVFVVHGPGQYHVQTSNLCGNVYTDTINVSPVIIPPLNIGPDAAVCISDTLRLQAQPGFASYNWFPANLVTGNGQQAYTIPAGNMNVWVTAVTPEGCKKADTLSITSISAPAVLLGRDTSFCINDSVILNAGTGYQQYIWSTGSTASSVTIKQAGTYWVKATAANGCSAKDTMLVLQTYALPQPTLGPDFSLCTGNQQRLDPGVFTSYLWQNGSTAAYINVSSPGTYHVKVTNANQCSAADTVLLVQILPSPAGFLAATDSICVFSSTVLSPLQNFTSYLWSTGTTQKEITVNTPGNYILSVVNNNGCTGKDTIAVYQKECFTGVFVPTAFTPNNDGRNDVFKPVISGTVLQLLFEVYDRAGQLVFSTSNPASGWNGTIQGIQQAAGVYAWQCRYQLAGQSSGYQKGTVMLIR